MGGQGTLLVEAAALFGHRFNSHQVERCVVNRPPDRRLHARTRQCQRTCPRRPMLLDLWVLAKMRAHLHGEFPREGFVDVARRGQELAPGGELLIARRALALWGPQGI
jgi:hypothetical protein